MRNNGLENGRTYGYVALPRPWRTRQELADEAAAGATKNTSTKVKTNAPPEWKQAAIAAVHSVASRKLTFTTDDVWKELGDRNHMHDNRAMGAIMRQATKLRYCSATETTQKTNRASNHHRPLTVWMSLVFSTAKIGCP